MWRRLMLGIRALWLPELRWFALQFEIWAASVVDFSQHPSAPDLALSWCLEWKEPRWSHWERNHYVLLPRACLLEIQHLAAACFYGSVPCACWQWLLWLIQDHTSGAPVCHCIARPTLCSYLMPCCGLEWVEPDCLPLQIRNGDKVASTLAPHQCKALFTVIASRPACLR